MPIPLVIALVALGYVVWRDRQAASSSEAWPMPGYLPPDSGAAGGAYTSASSQTTMPDTGDGGDFASGGSSGGGGPSYVPFGGPTSPTLASTPGPNVPNPNAVGPTPLGALTPITFAAAATPQDAAIPTIAFVARPVGFSPSALKAGIIAQTLASRTSPGTVAASAQNAVSQTPLANITAPVVSDALSLFSNLGKNVPPVSAPPPPAPSAPPAPNAPSAPASSRFGTSTSALSVKR